MLFRIHDIFRCLHIDRVTSVRVLMQGYDHCCTRNDRNLCNATLPSSTTQWTMAINKFSSARFHKPSSDPLVMLISIVLPQTLVASRLHHRYPHAVPTGRATTLSGWTALFHIFAPQRLEDSRHVIPLEVFIALTQPLPRLKVFFLRFPLAPTWLRTTGRLMSLTSTGNVITKQNYSVSMAHNKCHPPSAFRRLCWNVKSQGQGHIGPLPFEFTGRHNLIVDHVVCALSQAASTLSRGQERS
ncbi:hypothetical protein F5148DRAFT_753269 [Russula earlei]|uniref:Uncharacterized protein n=1 Tax=Russula earlei TaxID=71964 RepID=A0ACC0UD49_9AGAM|nr:hypothetical protein F5148DRAFT_753269 [Russula earlei]